MKFTQGVIWGVHDLCTSHVLEDQVSDHNSWEMFKKQPTHSMRSTALDHNLLVRLLILSLGQAS